MAAALEPASPFPPYFKPTPSVRSRNNYFPNSEKLGPDEMRISFMGSTPFPPRIDQAGTCIMVELGNGDSREAKVEVLITNDPPTARITAPNNGDSFFFDFGPGCLRNIIAMGHSQQLVQDIFITHLHVDHYHDLSYLLPFSAWSGRYTPLRVHGPSGRAQVAPRSL